MNEEIDKLLKLLIEGKKDYFYNKNKDFLPILDAALLTDDEKVIFVRALVNDKHDFFMWYTLICEILKTVTIYSNEFVGIIQDIIIIVSNDMAQGQFIDLLVDYGKRNNYMDIYSKLISVAKNDTIYHYAGIILGGRGLEHPEEIVEYIDTHKELNNANPKKAFIVASYINATRIFLDKYHADIDVFLRKLLVYSVNSEFLEVRIEAVRLAFDYYRHNPELSYEQLTILTDKNSEELFRMISEMLWLKGLDSEHVREFIIFKKVVEKTLDKFVGERSFFFLAKNNKFDVNTSFDCFIILMSKELYNNSSMMYYAMEMMGKDAFENYKAKLMDYITNFVNDINKIGILSELEFLINESFGKMVKNKETDIQELITAINIKRKELWNKN
jgi:hypothetical protein